MRARWLQERGQPAAALPYYSAALDVQRKALGERTSAVASTLLNIAMAHKALKQYDEALAALQESLAIRKEVCAGPARAAS